MSSTQGSSNILRIIDSYDIVVYDVENVNPNKKLLVLDSNKGKILLQKYFGTSKQLWLAYNVFKTLMGNDVLKITNWYTTADGAPFVEADKNLYYCTKYNDSKLTAEVSLVDHMSFLAKWHYLSREIVYARDFADSLTTPRSIDNQIKEQQIEKTALELKKRIINNIKQLSLYNFPEKKLTVTLPTFNIKRLVREEDDCLFQPWQQIFNWNWQLTDIASLLSFFKFDKTENIKEALSKYDKLNPLSIDEWKALPSLMLWNLCNEMNYDLVSDSYYELYETLCNIVSDRGIDVEDKIIFPIEKEEELITEDSTQNISYPDLVEDNVNIVVVSPQAVTNEEVNYESNSSEKIVQFVSKEVENKDTPLEENVTPTVNTNEDETESIAEAEVEIKYEDKLEISYKKDEINEQEEKEAEKEEIKVKLEKLNWKPFPESPFRN